MQRGFSLVELSIVLVILGLLVGGVLSGQSLIRAAELRSVSTEYGKYKAATLTFRDKYFAVPGDMATATSFWGKDNAACAGDPGAIGTPGTCNGNGDGMLYVNLPAGNTQENFQFWKQLALAGLVEGNYTGLSGPNNNLEGIIGTNVPRSRMNNAGWSVFYQGNFAGNGVTFGGSWGQVFWFGAAYPNNGMLGAALKPEEAWNIDTKLDDGKPGTGMVVAFFWNNACSNGASQSDTANAVYRLSDSSIQCSLQFNNQF